MRPKTHAQNTVPPLGCTQHFPPLHSGFKKLISLGTCTAHNTDPSDRPREHKESGQLTPGWLWLFETRTHSWEWQVSLTGVVKRYLPALHGPLGGPRTVVDGSPFHDVWLAGVGFGRSHQDTRSAKRVGEELLFGNRKRERRRRSLWSSLPTETRVGVKGRNVFRMETDCQTWFPRGNLWASETWFGRGCK